MEQRFISGEQCVDHISIIVKDQPLLLKIELGRGPLIVPGGSGSRANERILLGAGIEQ